MGCGVVVVVVVWVDRRRWVAGLWVGLLVDWCVRGGGSGGFHGGGCGCCLVGLVDRCVPGGGSAWLIFFFFVVGCGGGGGCGCVCVAVMYVYSEYIILL